MNAETHMFNRALYASNNNIKFNKKTIYKGIPKDKTDILNILNEKYSAAISKQSTPVGHKNLIYFSVFGTGFVMLFELLIKSIIKHNDPKNFDLLVITDELHKKAIRSIPELSNFSYDFYIIDTPEDCVEASASKLLIFDYPRINEYKNILFLDADILCTGDISHLFDGVYYKLETVDNQYKLYKQENIIDYRIISAATITHSVCYFLPKEWNYIEKEDPIVFNAGQFLLTNTEQMQAHFENVRWLMKVWPSIYFFEQSFLNQYFVIKKLCNYGILNDITNLTKSIPNIFDKNLDWSIYEQTQEKKLYHFAGSSTNSSFKYKFISTYSKKYNICQ
jgi:lipopolysaccharide biosynthesis glycosyltransferase